MDDPKLEVLKYEPLSEVAAALRKRKDPIVQSWRKKVLEVLPQADELTLSQLRNSIPVLLDEIATALAASEPAPAQHLINSSPEHGAARFHQNFNLNELLIEYHLLRGTIFEQLEHALKRPMRAVEVVGVNSGIDIGMRRAAVAFAHDQAREVTFEAGATAKYTTFI